MIGIEQYRKIQEYKALGLAHVNTGVIVLEITS